MNNKRISEIYLLLEYHHYLEELEKLARQLKPEILNKCTRIHERYKNNGGHAVFEVTHDICWCKCKLPTKNVGLLRSDVIFTCENCGRLLVQKRKNGK